MKVLNVLAVTALAVTVLGAGGPARAADLLVSSRNTHQVLRYNGATGAFITAFVPAGSGGLSGPAGLAFGPDADLYVAGTATDGVLRYDGTTGASIDTFAAAGLDGPSGIAFGPDGHLYVSNRLDHSVLRYHGVTGGLLGTFVAAGSAGLDEPAGLAFGPDGNLYVSSFGTGRVLRYDGATGAPIGTFASNSGLDGPEGLAFGADGHLYVSSFLSHRVLRFNGSTGAFMNTFVAAGSGGLSGPVGLVFGPDGHLYVSSSNTDQVLRYDKTTGVIMSTFVGAGSGGLDGPGFLLFDPVKVVDAGGGGHYTTIQAAVNDLPNPGPRIVKVRAGTYREAVTISGKNAAAVVELQRIVIMADPDAEPGSVIVTPPKGRITVLLEQSKFITLKGFTLTGGTRQAVFLRAGVSRDITLEGNDIRDNGSAQASGGIFVGRDIPRVWVVNNLIRANGRNGVNVECGVQNAPKYFVNNTVVQNGFNGFFLGDGVKDEIFLVNNLIVGNGTAPGVTGGRFGVLRESGAPATGPGRRATVFLRSNMFYRNTGGDIGNVVQTLDAADSSNFTTTGAEAASCYPNPGGCSGAIAGCTFAGCGATHALDEIFANPAGGDFRLIAGSPAVGVGQASFVNGGAERVPARDFEGNPRAVGAAVAAGYHELP